MSHILGIGVATLDVINEVDCYPQEDTEVRALNQRICRGGNVTNTLVVLSQLGHHCNWGGVYADEPDGLRILEDLRHYAIDTRYCRIISHGKMPTSYITLNQRNGSRTIVHYRDLPEFTFQDFRSIDLSPFAWVHFEGRNVLETVQMLRWLKQVRPTVPISIEIEKPRSEIEQLFNYAEVLLFSRGFAQHLGYSEAIPFLHAMRQQVSNARLICAWGTGGGYALDSDNQLVHSPAYLPTVVIDTLGAGDTFNAGVIDGLCRGQDLTTTIAQACRLAGEKCGRYGFCIKPVAEK